MTQEALLNAIEQDAGVECDRIMAEAAGAAEEILKNARSAADGYASERLALIREDFSRRRAAVLNSAKTRMNSLRLEVMNSAVDEVFAEVKRRISLMPRTEYESLVKELYLELDEIWVSEFGADGAGVVFVNPADIGILQGAKAACAPDPAVEHGVAIASVDNKIRYENTIESRLRRARQDLVPIIEKTIFG